MATVDATAQDSLLGIDVGSSAVKAALISANNGTFIGHATSPSDNELPINAPKAGWAEQSPEMWWEHVHAVCALLRRNYPAAYQRVQAIGISYQMHGLVVLDQNNRPLRPAIIWCDSRAVEIGREAQQKLGEEYCLHSLLNSPGNFTASKLAWVKRNEPELYAKIHTAILPGDYIALRLTGNRTTTVSGLSEGTLWDFKQGHRASPVLTYFGISEDIFPSAESNLGIQGEVLPEVANELGLPKGVVVSYRAGDQPNNALSLNVLEPGEIAATAGTSGVIYGITDRPLSDPHSRVNIFLHANHSPDEPRYGVLLCINGAGILNRWVRELLAGTHSLPYDQLDALAATVPPGSAGLTVLPFGNGAERSLGDEDIGASVHHLSLTTHHRGHFVRAAQEGIAFALGHGVGIMREMGMEVRNMRAGKANMFLSPIFREALAATLGVEIELFDTDGAQGAARGAGIGAGIFENYEQAFASLRPLMTISPEPNVVSRYCEAFARWKEVLAAVDSDFKKRRKT